MSRRVRRRRAGTRANACSSPIVIFGSIRLKIRFSTTVFLCPPLFHLISPDYEEIDIDTLVETVSSGKFVGSGSSRFSHITSQRCVFV